MQLLSFSWQSEFLSKGGLSGLASRATLYHISYRPLSQAERGFQLSRASHFTSDCDKFFKHDPIRSLVKKLSCFSKMRSSRRSYVDLGGFIIFFIKN